MKNYVEENITQKSHTTLKYAMKMLANSSEAIIFVFLGVCTVNDSHDWNTPFVVLTILFCIVYRAIGKHEQKRLIKLILWGVGWIQFSLLFHLIIGVILITAAANKFRLHRLNKVEQFIMSYGGLRGAVAFALVLVISEQIIPTKKMMVTTIIAVVYFTVFLQGT